LLCVTLFVATGYFCFHAFIHPVMPFLKSISAQDIPALSFLTILNTSNHKTFAEIREKFVITVTPCFNDALVLDE
jgi:hypothetical protein